MAFFPLPFSHTMKEEGGTAHVPIQNGTNESACQAVAAAKHGNTGHYLDVHLLLYPYVLADHRLYGLQHC
jgi:hypothetical protein